MLNRLQAVPATGMCKDLAAVGATNPAQAGLMAMLADGRYQTLQKTPAPISYLDVVFPFPNQLVTNSPIPGVGDPGGYASARSLEDI